MILIWKYFLYFAFCKNAAIYIGRQTDGDKFIQTEKHYWKYYLFLKAGGKSYQRFEKTTKRSQQDFVQIREGQRGAFKEKNKDAHLLSTGIFIGKFSHLSCSLRPKRIVLILIQNRVCNNINLFLIFLLAYSNTIKICISVNLYCKVILIYGN